MISHGILKRLSLLNANFPLMVLTIDCKLPLGILSAGSTVAGTQLAA